MTAEPREAGAVLGLESAVSEMPGIGPKRAALLENLSIRSLRDLLLHLPKDYQDRSAIAPIASVRAGEVATVQGEVLSARNVRLRGRRNMAVIRIKDGSGEIGATFFGRGFLANAALKPGARAIFTGHVEDRKGLSLKNPEYEALSGDASDQLHTGRIVPMYRLTEGVSQRMLRGWVRRALDLLAEGIEEPASGGVLEDRDYPGFATALACVHFPGSVEEAARARERFVYEELLGLQCAILLHRAESLESWNGIRHQIEGRALGELTKTLPFALTAPQRRAVDDILADMAAPRPMARLLQGDVGCGKTVVALHAMAAAAGGGYQTAMMVPTEILAEQHGMHLRRMLEPLGLVVETLTGAMRNAAAVRERVARGEVHVLVGTHALYQESTQFHNLGLVVIDEQHRFGVSQRHRLAAKGQRPDVLHMSATPIPRTLAITLYGGMDVSVIDALPPGRKPVKTRRIPPAKTSDLYQYIREQAAEGWQTYIVCPLVEESERREDLTDVIGHFEAAADGPLAGLRCALMHGRLDAGEKEGIMTAFKGQEIDVLFSTTVIEVGVDVPTATTMVIEDAPQFGLTQLHQLRGRVGRGNAQAYCFLLGTPRTPEGRMRLDILCSTTDGFEIAEADLDMRGPGEFYGVRQAGLTDLRVADLVRDARLLDQARRDAARLVAQEPETARAMATANRIDPARFA